MKWADVKMKMKLGIAEAVLRRPAECVVVQIQSWSESWSQSWS